MNLNTVNKVQKDSPFMVSSSCNEPLQLIAPDKTIDRLRKMDPEHEAILRQITQLSQNFMQLPLIPERENLVKLYVTLMEISRVINKQMQAVAQLFYSSLANERVSYKAKNSWLQLECTERNIKQRKSYKVFGQYSDFKSGEIKWRIGGTYERRYYSELMFNSENEYMKSAFNHESLANQKIILEFDRVILQLIILRQHIRDIDSSLASRMESLNKHTELIHIYQQIGKVS